MKRTLQSAALMASITVTSAAAQEQLPDVTVSEICAISYIGYSQHVIDMLLTAHMDMLMPKLLDAIRNGADPKTAQEAFAQAVADGVCAQIIKEENPA